MLAHEAKVREELKVFEAQVDELAAKRKEELLKKSKAQLKDMCADKDLPVAGDNEERIQRILEEAKKDREFDQTVCSNNRTKRMREKSDIEPFVSCIMVERIMAHESQGGAAIVTK